MKWSWCVLGGGGYLLGVQLVAVVFLITWAAASTFVLLYVSTSDRVHNIIMRKCSYIVLGEYTHKKGHVINDYYVNVQF